MARVMELYIAPSQAARGGIAIGQADAESIIAAGLAIIRHLHLIGAPRHAINLASAFDKPRCGTGDHVHRTTGPLHLHSGSMVYIMQMAPKTPIFDATRYREGASSPGGRAGDPPAAGHELPAGAGGPAAV